MSRLQLNLLGQFEINLDNEPISWFPTDRVRALLMILATEPSLSYARGSVASLLWSDMDESAAKRNLRRCISRLKKVFGDSVDDLLEVSRNSIGLLSAETDIQKFHTLSASNDPSDWQAAADLVNGELLQGFHLKNSMLFEEWLANKRLEFVQQQRDLLQKLLDSVAVNPAAHLRYAQQLISAEPYDEVAQRAVMTAHVSLGNTGAAVVHYEQYCEQLLEEIGADPEPETQALYEKIVATMAVKPLDLHHFPVQHSAFIGRVADRDAVLELLRQDECHMVTILGAGGIGKTWLAIEVAQHLSSAQFSDGAYFVPLVTATTEHDVIALLHSSLELPMQGDNMLEQLVEFLHNKRLLLLLDNLEQLSGQLRFLARLLQGAGGVKILATSRDVVGISAEYRYPLSGITDLHEATSVLWSAIRRIAPSFEVTPTNIAIGAVICERLHGVPLALELAATWINTLDLESIREEIDHAYTFLESPLLDTPDRHRSLSAIFNHSWDLLTPKRQQMLAVASIFRGGFDMKAARVVMGAGINDLRRLVEQSLLIKTGERPRYRPHEMVREFAEDKLTPSIANDARGVHANHYLSLVAGLAQQLVSEDSLAASKTITIDLENVKAAWRWAVAQSSAELLQKAVTALTRFYRLTGRYAEGNRLFVETIEGLGVKRDAALLAQLHIGCATFRIGQMQNDKCIVSAEKALAAATTAADNALIAESLSLWGQALRSKGTYRLAVAKLQEALAACDGIDAHAVRGEILSNLSIIAAFSGNPVKSMKISESALAAARASGNTVIEVQAHNVISYGLAQTFKITQALALTEATSELSRKTGNLGGDALALISNGRAHQFIGQYANAEESLLSALKLYRAIEDRLGAVYALSQLARIHLETNAYEAAMDYSAEVIAIAQSQPIAFHHANVLLMQGRILCLLEQFEEAERITIEASQLVAANKLPAMLRLSAEAVCAEIALRQGLPEVALTHISKEVDQIIEKQVVPRPVETSYCYMLAYETLIANQDARAAAVLQLGYEDVMSKAAQVSNLDQRQSYLDQVSYNSILLAMYRAQAEA